MWLSSCCDSEGKDDTLIKLVILVSFAHIKYSHHKIQLNHYDQLDQFNNVFSTFSTSLVRVWVKKNNFLGWTIPLKLCRSTAQYRGISAAYTVQEHWKPIVCRVCNRPHITQNLWKGSAHCVKSGSSSFTYNPQKAKLLTICRNARMRHTNCFSCTVATNQWLDFRFVKKKILR